ncbi:hypothetical protein BH11MYX1_BH11MYX1_01440 [soil metagenome]
MTDAAVARVGAALSSSVRATSRAAFVAAMRRPNTVGFVEASLLGTFVGDVIIGPVVAVIASTNRQDVLAQTIELLATYPWLSHVVSEALYEKSFARAHLENLLDQLEHGSDNTMKVGRVALLARASKRNARFDRMLEFFEGHGVSSRTLANLGDVAEELVMNALYDAPHYAGFLREAFPRTEDVELPPDRACEIGYGIKDECAFIRLRDPFGSLDRSRLLQVLARCRRKAVELDTSRGGAGLGWWRMMSLATSVSITVVPKQLTNITIAIALAPGPKHLVATHLHFTPVEVADVFDFDSILVAEKFDNSVTLLA